MYQAVKILEEKDLFGGSGIMYEVVLIGHGSNKTIYRGGSIRQALKMEYKAIKAYNI